MLHLRWKRVTEEKTCPTGEKDHFLEKILLSPDVKTLFFGNNQSHFMWRHIFHINYPFHMRWRPLKKIFAILTWCEDGFWRNLCVSHEVKQVFFGKYQFHRRWSGIFRIKYPFHMRWRPFFEIFALFTWCEGGFRSIYRSHQRWSNTFRESSGFTNNEDRFSEILLFSPSVKTRVLDTIITKYEWGNPVHSVPYSWFGVKFR